MTVLCNGNRGKSAVITCSTGYGWRGRVDWYNLDCRDKAVQRDVESGNETESKSTVFRKSGAGGVGLEGFMWLGLLFFLNACTS